MDSKYKIMLTFKQFIREGVEEWSKPISVDEAIEFLEKNCVQSMKNRPLWRGGPRTRISYGDSHLGEPRVSANTSNYYTLIVDNLPAWKFFPKRSRSFIGSSDIDGAYDVGPGPCLMIPFDNAKVGVCPREDFWTSFDSIESLEDLNYMLSNIIGFMEFECPETWTWEALKPILKRITAAGIKDHDVKRTANGLVLDFRTLLLDQGSESSSALSGLSRILAPRDFENYTGADYKVADNKEVFVEGKVIMIAQNLEDAINNFDRLKITQFLKSKNPELAKNLK